MYLATLASVLGPMSFGFVLGYSSPAIPELAGSPDPRLRLDDVQASWFGVSASPRVTAAAGPDAARDGGGSVFFGGDFSRW